MNKTVIFISGWSVPKFIAQTRLVWNKPFWSDYRCIWLDSKTPTSDQMIKSELDRLQHVVENNPGCAVVGQSLGGWWAANLALRDNVEIKKLVLWTPVCDVSAYPIFKASRNYHPPKLATYNFQNTGPHKVLTMIGERDWFVPPDAHAHELAKCFNSMTYSLDGGHFFQYNHQAALQYMKDWIELE